MTLPNVITVFRFILAGVFAWLMVEYAHSGETMYRHIAFAVFVLAAVSDFADGYIARRWGLESRWGVFMDPLADKLLSFIVLICLLWIPPLHGGVDVVLIWIFAALFIWRETLILGGIALLRLMRRDVRISPLGWGKWCTAIQFITLAGLIFGLGRAGNILVLISSLFLLVSGIAYFREGVRLLRKAGTV